jgi:hypothetical protein
VFSLLQLMVAMASGAAAVFSLGSTGAALHGLASRSRWLVIRI